MGNEANPKPVGFDNAKYEQIQSAHIKERTEKFLFYDAIQYLKYTRPDKNDELYQKAASILEEIKTAPAEYGWKGKVKLTVWKISPSLFHLMYYFVRKVKR